MPGWFWAFGAPSEAAHHGGPAIRAEPGGARGCLGGGLQPLRRGNGKFRVPGWFWALGAPSAAAHHPAPAIRAGNLSGTRWRWRGWLPEMEATVLYSSMGRTARAFKNAAAALPHRAWRQSAPRGCWRWLRFGGGGGAALFDDGEEAGTERRGRSRTPPRVEAERAEGLLEVAALRRWRRRCSF